MMVLLRGGRRVTWARSGGGYPSIKLAIVRAELESLVSLVAETTMPRSTQPLTLRARAEAGGAAAGGAAAGGAAAGPSSAPEMRLVCVP